MPQKAFSDAMSRSVARIVFFIIKKSTVNGQQSTVLGYAWMISVVRCLLSVVLLINNYFLCLNSFFVNNSYDVCCIVEFAYADSVVAVCMFVAINNAA